MNLRRSLRPRSRECTAMTRLVGKTEPAAQCGVTTRFERDEIRDLVRSDDWYARRPRTTFVNQPQRAVVCRADLARVPPLRGSRRSRNA